jgi:hypothetical protein
MKKVVFSLLVALPSLLSAQFFSGYYQSEPQMEGFDHFVVKHKHGDEGRYDGVFSLHAYIGHDEMWSQNAQTIHGDEAQYFIKKYSGGEDILSVHKMKIIWDGVEWEFFMLGYLDKHHHGRFIVVEEIFSDKTENELLELKKYYWKKGHHLSKKSLVKQR